MIENVLPGVFRVAVPLVDNPLQAVNSYILKGQDRHLVIDTGMARDECKKALFGAFAELEMEIEQTDFFITHLHVDHLELVYKIASARSNVYFNKPDAEIVFDDSSWNSAVAFAVLNGFPRSELQEMIQTISRSYISTFDSDVEFTLLKEGDKISVGDYELTCLETPGHSPGSMCLYDANYKLLFSGDHILEEVTPNISLLMEREFNPLKSYLESLDKIFALNLNLILPGHRGLIRAPQQRIRELQDHHRQREAEVLTILSKGPADGYTVASCMSWDVPSPSWQEFPVFQRWFATGEALAHLKYLKSKGMVGSYEKSGKIIYSISQNK